MSERASECQVGYRDPPLHSASARVNPAIREGARRPLIPSL
jgi:hypothetical protein